MAMALLATEDRALSPDFGHANDEAVQLALVLGHIKIENACNRDVFC